MVAQADQTGTPISTWALACQKANTSADRNRLDGHFRYHLELLADNNLLLRKTYKKGKARITGYTSNPKKLCCADGSLFVFDETILVIACKYTDTCQSNCQIEIKRNHGNYTINGCRTIQEATETIKATVYNCLKNQKPKSPPKLPKLKEEKIVLPVENPKPVAP
jgi:uncharacterized phage protein gp47/JayE